MRRERLGVRRPAQQPCAPQKEQEPRRASRSLGRSPADEVLRVSLSIHEVIRPAPGTWFTPTSTGPADLLRRTRPPARSLAALLMISSQHDHPLGVAPVMPGLEQLGTSAWLHVHETRIVYADAPSQPEKRSSHGPEGADPLHRRPRWQRR